MVATFLWACFAEGSDLILKGNGKKSFFLNEKKKKKFSLMKIKVILCGRVKIDSMCFCAFPFLCFSVQILIYTYVKY